MTKHPPGVNRHSGRRVRCYQRHTRRQAAGGGDLVTDETTERQQARSDPAGTAPSMSRMNNIKAAQIRMVDEVTEIRNRLEEARPRR